MRIRFVISLLGLIIVSALVGAGQSRPAESMLEAARKMEVVDGDFQGAIKQYQLILKQYEKTDRVSSATALLSMAEAYEKLGSAQARNVYERILKDFSDQVGAASTARTRLGAAPTSSSKLLRPIWSGTSVIGAGTVSGDGRFVSFVDWDTGNVAVRDLSTGTDLRLTNIVPGSGDEVQDSAISRDGTKIAYSWWIKGSANELRVVSRTSGSLPSPRTLLANSEIRYVAPFDWSPTADWIAVQVKRADGTAQIGVLTADDGRLSTLKSIDWRGVSKMSVSPDGGFIAYDLPVDETSNRRDIFVISRDGRREQSINARSGYNVVVGWTPDGKSLLYATSRSGTMGLWAVPMANGAPQAPPRLLDPDLGTFSASLGVTNSGRLVFTKKVGGTNIYTTAVDFTTGTVLSIPEPVTDSLLHNHSGAMWSPDGASLAYTSKGRGTNSILMRSIEGGQVREFTPRVSNFLFPRWSAQDFITFQASDLKGRQGIFRMDVRTGETTLIVGGDGEGYRSWASASRDGSHVVYTKNKANTLTLIARNLTSGTEHVLARSSATGTTVSPDGRLVAYRTGDRTSSSIVVVPMEGGAPREILRVNTPSSLFHAVDWLPDGRRLLARRSENGKAHLLVLSLDGGKPVELPSSLDPLGPFFRVHPDGQRVAYSAGEPAFELWSLENFLPSKSASR